VHLGDDEKDALGLEVLVRHAVRPQQLGPAHLEPDRIYAVVHDAGLVRLGVPRHNLYRVTVNGYSFRKIHHTTSFGQNITNPALCKTQPGKKTPRHKGNRGLRRFNGFGPERHKGNRGFHGFHGLNGFVGHEDAKTRRVQVLVRHGLTWRGLWPQPNPKHEIRNPKQIQITETQNSKQTITSYFDGGYGNRIPISSRKNKNLTDCSTIGERRQNVEQQTLNYEQ
jgi:hypothetical protein